MITIFTCTLSSLAMSLLATNPAPSSTPVQSAPIAATQAAPTQSAPWPKNDAGLNALGEKLTKSWFGQIAAKDWTAVEQQLHSSFQRINFEGAFDRAAEIIEIKALGLGSAKFSTFHATRVGEALVVTCMVKASESAGGSKLSADETGRLGVWKWFDGGWQLTAWVSLNMPEARPAPSAPRFAGDAAINAQGQALVANFLALQHDKKIDAFSAMLAEGMQAANFKGLKLRPDMIKGAEAATVDTAVIADARTTIAGDLTIVTCTLTMGQKVGWSTLPAKPAPFMAVFQTSKTAAGVSVVQVIALGNTNKPE